MSVTIVLNCFKRPHALIEQYQAIKNQSYNDIDIFLWCNHSEYSLQEYPQEVIQNCTTAYCNKNLGVWARFAFALNIFTKYICVIDDDTIPGKKWIENCVHTIQTHKGLLGCRGVKMIDNTYANYPNCNYQSITRNDKTERVDIIGHSWFFERDWLRAYWVEAPNIPLSRGGEDMHFSYVLQKHLGLYSYIPPQPESDQDLWGSKDPSKYGEDIAATSRTYNGAIEANHYWNFILKQGYKLTKDANS